MLPQQKPQEQIELKAICNALWGQTATCVYTILLQHFRQQFWGLSIHAVLIPDLYSQLAWVPLSAAPHGKHWEHSAPTAPTKASHTHHLAGLPCLAPLPGASSTCQHVPHHSAWDAPHHSHSQAEITFLCRMAQLGGVFCTPIICVPPMYTGKHKVVLMNRPVKSWHMVKY